MAPRYHPDAVNAAAVLLALVAPATARRLGADAEARYRGDLVSLLNRLRKDELSALAARLRLAADDDAGGAARARCGGGAPWPRPAARRTWAAGCSRCRRARRAACPRRAARGLAPRAARVAAPHPAAAAAGPAGRRARRRRLLLAAADRALGVRLPARGRDKGAWGRAAAALLGVIERGADEPDWRGEVELKTVPVARDRAGSWRVTEDPAVAMEGASPLGQARPGAVAVPGRPVGDGATLISWYLLDWDADLARWIRRDLHTRPKGPRGTAARGWYLHKRFFVDAGLYATLNGPPVTP
jgi:hypothetical protein